MKGRLTFHYKSFCTILISDYFPVFSIYTERGEKEALKNLSDNQPLPCLTAGISNLPHSPQTPCPVAYSEHLQPHHLPEHRQSYHQAMDLVFYFREKETSFVSQFTPINLLLAASMVPPSLRRKGVTPSKSCILHASSSFCREILPPLLLSPFP